MEKTSLSTLSILKLNSFPDCLDFNSYNDFQIIPVSSMSGSHFLLVLYKYLIIGTELLPHLVSNLNQNANGLNLKVYYTAKTFPKDR